MIIGHSSLDFLHHVPVNVNTFLWWRVRGKREEGKGSAQL